MQKIILFILFVFGAAAGHTQLPSICSGTLRRFEDFQSCYVSARNVDVWLPAGYDSVKKYNVLYMHDGQMLYDSTVTWNHQAWEVDDMITKLMHEGKIKDVIVVGIWNSGGSRHADYFPQKPFETLSQPEKDTVYAAGRANGYPVFNNYKIHSDACLKFLVTELKPFIDSAFKTYTDRKHTFIMGSSMGGLISMYAICEYPHVFGGAACLSTHWPGIFTMQNNPVPAAFISYMKTHLPNPRTHKIYFDYGTETLDAMYPPLQAKADEVMREKGYTKKNWLTKAFPGEDHSEKAWNKRLDIPLVFLLGK